MRTQQDLRRRLGIAYPIIQAPMAGATTPELVAAVSNAGGLGMIGAAYFTPAQITEAIERVRALTDRPFGVNLFAGGRDSAPDVDPGPTLALVARYHAELGLPAPEPPSLLPDPFPAQLASVLAARVPVFSFTFGVPSQGGADRGDDRRAHKCRVDPDHQAVGRGAGRRVARGSVVTLGAPGRA